MKVLCFTAFFWSVFAVASGNLPYSEQNQVQLNMVDGIVLTGTWTFPTLSLPSKVAVIVQGSGNVGQDGDVSSPFVGRGYQNQPAKLSEQLAQNLAEAGIASIRFNKRGFENSAQLANQTVPYLVQDLKSVVAIAQRRFRDLPVVLVGFSEGALLSVLAAQPESHVASIIKGLYLMGAPTRNIDELFDYQFVQWPVNLLTQSLDLNLDGIIAASELSVLNPDFRLPVAGSEYPSIDFNQDGALAVTTEVLPAYQGLRAQIADLAQSPEYAPWYNAMKQVPAWSMLTQGVRIPVFAYHGALDPQVNPESTRLDLNGFTNLRSFKLYPMMGHAFAPLEGQLGQIKTSGPIAQSVLNDLVNDVYTH